MIAPWRLDKLTQRTLRELGRVQSELEFYRHLPAACRPGFIITTVAGTTYTCRTSWSFSGWAGFATPLKNCSPGRIRTSDPAVNSHAGAMPSTAAVNAPAPYAYAR